MDEQRLQELNAIRDRMAGGMSGYQAINYNSLPQNPVPFQNYSNFVNEQNKIETDYKLFKSFYNGGVSIINGMIGTGRMLADRRLNYEAQEGEAAGMEGVSSAAAAEVNKPTTLLKRYNIQANTTTEQLIYGVAEGATQLAGQALVTLATGGIGGGIFMGAQIAGNQYNELRDAGVEPDRAFEASVANALIQTPLEQLSFGKLMKSLPANSKLKAKLYQVLESTLTEGLTEGLQELPEQLTSIWAKNNGIDALGVAREWDKNASDNIKDMVYSGVIGGILGGGASGIRVAISSKLEKAFIDYQNENITASAENAKKNGMSAQQTQQVVDLNDRGETAVNIDAQQVLSYAQTQQVDVEKVATSLGVTASEIEDAAEAGLDITVSKGHMVQAMMEQNGFSEAIIPHVSYGEQGRSLNYYQMQEEMSKAYGEGSEVVKALDEELNAIEQSMLDAGVAKDQAKQARELYNAFVVSMSPDNPAEWIKNHKVRFANEGKVSKKDSLFQVVYHGSPAKFDKFDLGSIGSGAGTNMHGWGIYFTKLKKVADGYKKALGKSKDKTTYQVDVPDDNYFLDENLSFNQQYQEVQEGIVKCLNKLTDNQKNIFWESILKYRLSSSSGLIKANKDYQNARAVYDAIDLVSSKSKFAFIAKKAEKTLFAAGYTIQDIERFKNDNNYRKHEKNKYKDGIAKQKALLDSAQNDNDEKHRQLVKQAIINPREFLKDNTINGQRIYNSLAQALSEEGAEMVDQKLASLHLNNYGVKGISYDGGPDGRCFVVFDDKAINILNAYNQSTEGTPKGSFSPQADGSYVISMFKNGDASTVIHETGHYFFEIFMQESGLDTASDKLKKDRAAFLNYVGMTEEQWRAADFEGRRAAHERVATAFEQYLLEGKAPSKGLRDVFSRFSKWLKAIYGNVVNSNDYAELTDDVRQVFDHWLAADADIEEAARTEGFFSKIDSRLTANLSDSKKKWLEDKINAAHDTAVEMLKKQYMKNFSAERRAQIVQYRKDMEPIVREAIHNERVNQARANIAEAFTQDVERTFKFKLFSDAKVKYNEHVIGRPIQIANRYINWLNQDASKDAAYQSVKNEIDAALQPEIEKLKQGFGVRSRVAYIDTVTGQEISFDEAQSRDKASPGYVTRFVSENDPWYQKWFAENHKQPTQADLLKIAEDLYCGIDEYGVYGDLLKAHSPAQQVEMDEYAKEQRAKLNEWYAERDKLLSENEYLGKKKKPALTDDEALYFESIAEDLGYSSGSEMAEDILKSKSEERMVREALDAEVNAAYPDYLKERTEAELAIIEALNNDKEGEVIALEQQLIEEAAQTAFVKEQTNQARMALANEQKARAEVIADKLMKAMSMGEALNTRKIAMQERRAAANAKKALKEGRFEDASEFKRQQMIAHAMVRNSLRIKQELNSFEKKVKKYYNLRKDSKAGDYTTFFRNWGSEENFMQIANYLMRINPNYKRADYDPERRTQTLAEYIQDMADKYSDMVVDISDNVTNEYVDISNKKSMSYELFLDVKNGLETLEAIVRQDKKAIIDGKTQDAGEVKKNILDNANKDKDLDVKRDSSGKVKRSLWRQFEASMMTLDNLVRRMDGWTEGYFTKTFLPMIKHSGDKYAQLMEQYRDRAQAAAVKWLKDRNARMAAFEPKYYKELGASTNKLVLVKMAANLGNDGNMRVLCGARPAIAKDSKLWVIAGENGNNISKDEAIALTRQNLVEFLSRNLTKEDIEYAQSLIDNCEASWPELAQVNIRTKGYAPEQVKATPVAFTLGNGEVVELRGGYIPLVRDTSSDRAQGQDIFSSTENDRYSNVATMSTNKSSSKKRTGASYAIDLSPNSEYFSMEQTFRDIAYREAIIQFNRFFKDKEIWNTLVAKYGQEHMQALVECISKCANPYSNTGADMAENIFGRIGNFIRKGAVNAIIAGNVKISLQNFGNIVLYDGAVEGYTFKDVLSTLPTIFGNGYAGHKAMRDEVFSKSIFMRERAKASDITMKEYLDAYENGLDKGGRLAEMNNWLLKKSATMLEVTDNITAVPNWLNAYHKKLNAGATEQEAIDYADTLIRRTLGSTRAEDVSSYQRGSKVFRLMTAFQGFFNTQLNQWLEQAHKTGRMIDDKKFKEAFYNVVPFLVKKWLLACVLNCLFAMENPFEEDKKGWKNISKELMNYPLAMWGYGGQVANAAISSALDMQNYGYKLSIVENSIERGIGVTRKVGDVLEGKKEWTELTEPILEIGCMITGAPLQLVRTGANVVDWLQDDINWEMADLIRRRPKSERNRN